MSSDQAIEIKASVPATFTDRDMSNFYKKLKTDYKSYLTPNGNFVAMRDALEAQFVEQGTLAHLPSSEKDKMRCVLHTFLNARGHYAQPRPYFTEDELVIRLVMHRLMNDDAFIRQYITSASTRRYLLEPYYYSHSSWYEGFFWGSWLSSRRSNSNRGAQVLLLLVGIIITSVAISYLLVAIAESLERFRHNEGWLQASISLLSIVIGAAAGAAAMMAIINPVGLMICVVVGASIVAAALTAATTNYIQGKLIQWSNPDAIDPVDPHRFELTDNDAANVEKNSLDPVKVKLAIVALRDAIDDLPSVYARMQLFSKDAVVQEKQDLIDKIRKLRQGICERDGTVEVNGMRFNLLPDTLLFPATADLAASNDDVVEDAAISPRSI